MNKPKNGDKKVIAGSTEGEVESKEETNLRPQKLREILGRKSERDSLKILLDAARKRKETVDHILFYGPPGLGKTTFAHVISNEMGAQIRITSGPAIERQGDLAAILTNLKPGDVLFIDEIHRLNRGVEEILYPAMEDYKLDIVVGKGPAARSIRLKLPKFTLIGATTRIGLLSSPLRDRFGFIQRLDYFDNASLSKIVLRAAEIMGVRIEKGGADEIARRSRGTARISIRLLKRVRDYSQVKNMDKVIDKKLAKTALDDLGVDKMGLDVLDRKILASLIKQYGGGPVGLTTIAAAVSEEVDTISDVYEPFLMQIGFIKRTSRGRVATPKAYDHLEMKYDGNTDQKSFI
jgi:Holliday junction DNA helicase RuvB